VAVSGGALHHAIVHIRRARRECPPGDDRRGERGIDSPGMVDAEETGEDLPAWSLPSSALSALRVESDWPQGVTREWAFGGSTGEGARVCVIDSGVDPHPLVGEVQSSVAVERGAPG
jgi:hypothetical protein